MKASEPFKQFWVVTKPTLISTLDDICFVCYFHRFAQQIRGGLEMDQVAGIFTDEQEAKGEAERLLVQR